MSTNCDHCQNALDVCKAILATMKELCVAVNILKNDVTIIKSVMVDDNPIIPTATTPTTILSDGLDILEHCGSIITKPSYSTVANDSPSSLATVLETSAVNALNTRKTRKKRNLSYRAIQPSPRLTRSGSKSKPKLDLPTTTVNTTLAPEFESANGNIPTTSVAAVSNVLPCPVKTSINVVGSGPPLLDLMVAEPRKMLYLSNLDPHTSVDRISRLIHTTFGINPFSCVKLVPTERDLNTLEYVSFKMQVPVKGFEAFLDSSLWPKGIIVREFIPKPKNSRKPATRI